MTEKRSFDKYEILVLKIMLLISFLLVSLALCFEFFKSKQIVPASIFVVLISLSALCMGWARVGILSNQVIKKVYFSGIDLFTSSLFALSAVPVAWFANNFKNTSEVTYDTLIILHIVLLMVAMLLGYRAIARLLNVVKQAHLHDSDSI